MRFGSLFAGIGGLDLGFERAGFECAWQVEIDDYAQAVCQAVADADRARSQRGVVDPPPVFGEGGGVIERPDWWEVEPGVGRVANGVPRRVDRLRCLGNAVVPQVAEHIAGRVARAIGRDRDATI